MGGIIRSPYVREVRSDAGELIAFHRLFGNATTLTPAEAELLSMFRGGQEVEGQVPGLEKLVTAGFIVPEGTDERAVLRRIIAERGELASTGALLRNLQLNISELCNFLCRYCIQQRALGELDREELEKKKMSIEVARYSVDTFLSVLRGHGNRKAHIMYFGGEPLTNIPIIEFVLDHVRTHHGDMDIAYSMTTNGSKITPGLADKLAAHNVAVQISLDGIGEVNDKNRIYARAAG